MTAQVNAQPKTQGAKCLAVRSMTGYGRATVEGFQRVTAEVRAVNGRFLKLSIKLPGRYGPLEDRIKTLITEQGIQRGNVDVSLFFEGVAAEDGNFSIDEDAVKRYAKQLRAVAKKHKLKGDVSVNALLPLPGVIRREEVTQELDQVWQIARKVLLEAVTQFNQMREREGAAMVADVRGQLARLIADRAAIQTAAPEVLKAVIQKFKDRIAKLLEQHTVSAPLNADVLEREVVLMADRTDVSEELARLQSHLQQMESALVAGGEVGKRLDFLTQELFRETNTIGSKAQDERITHHVVDMKGVIEKIREQVQNLE